MPWNQWKRKQQLVDKDATDLCEFDQADTRYEYTASDSTGRALHKHCRRGSLESVIRIHRETATLSDNARRKLYNKRDNDGLTVLHIAARYCHLDILKYVIAEMKPDVNIPDPEGGVALHHAVRRTPTPENEEVLRDVIGILAENTKGGVNVKDHYGRTPLHIAAMRENIPAAKILLSFVNIDLNARTLLQCSPLHVGVTFGYVEMAGLLVNAGASIHATDKEGLNPLHLACAEGYLEIFELLMTCAEQDKQMRRLVDAKDRMQFTPLHHAVKMGHLKIVNQLVTRYDADVTVRCNAKTTNDTALHLAAEAGNVDMSSFLVEYGAPLESLDSLGRSPLHCAAAMGHCDIVRFFLETGKVDVNCRDKDNRTPLIIASAVGSLPTVRVLLDHGSNVTATDIKETNAIYEAAANNQVEVLEILLHFIDARHDKTDLTSHDDHLGNTALHAACKYGHVQCVKLLLDHDADADNKNNKKETPLLLAAASGCSEIVSKLLDLRGDQMNHSDEQRNTALHLAAEHGHHAIVQMLIDRGAEKEPRNRNKATPLDVAAAAGHVITVTSLLRCGVSVDPLGVEMATPLLWASQNGHADIVRTLLHAGADVTLTDAYGRHSLAAAIECGHSDVASVLVSSAAWKDALSVVHTAGRELPDTPMRQLIRHMPDVAEEVLDRCMNTMERPNHPDFTMTFYYELLDDAYSIVEWNGGSEAFDLSGNIRAGAEIYTDNSMDLKRNHPLMIMVSHGRRNLLYHPVVLSLIRRKWRLASVVYSLFLIFYVTFMITFTSFLSRATPPYAVAKVNGTPCPVHTTVSYDAQFSDVYMYCIMGMAAFGILTEIIQISALSWAYVSVCNLVDWCLYLAAVLVMLPHLTNCGIRTAWQWQLGTLCVFVGWMNLLFFLRRSQSIGIYVIMITQITCTFLKLLLVFFLFLLAFGFSFYALLQNQVPFQTPFFSTMKSFIMMIGEMDYGEIFYSSAQVAPPYESFVAYKVITYLIYCAFVILMTIIVMNLLTGLAVDDVSSLHKQAKLKKLAMQIELSLDVEIAKEKLMLRWPSLTTVSRDETIQPNKLNENDSRFWRWLVQHWQGVLSERHITAAVIAKTEGRPASTDTSDQEDDTAHEQNRTHQQLKALKKKKVPTATLR